MKKFVVTGLILIFLFGLIPPAFCQESTATKSAPSGGAMIADLVFLRPAGIVSCAVGLVAAVVSIPFVALSTTTYGEVVDAFLTKPGDFTFVRPLGEGL
jgi:hypothetical protein